MGGREVHRALGRLRRAGGQFQPNNYYLYSDPAGRFQMLPWGTDETCERRLPFDGPAGLLFDKCLADPACAALYREELGGARRDPGLGLDPCCRHRGVLEPW